uniref:Uncharacterized protein n=1 Tax=Romanomermis culicivorax TaxID=13658 RepID=A0A915L4E3_ROMCU
MFLNYLEIDLSIYGETDQNLVLMKDAVTQFYRVCDDVTLTGKSHVMLGRKDYFSVTLMEKHKQEDEQRSKENSSEIQGPQRQTEWEMIKQPVCGILQTKQSIV